MSLILQKKISAPGLAWQAALKKDWQTEMNILLMVEKSIRGGLCHSIYRYANYTYMTDYDGNKQSSYFKYWDVNDLYGWAMSKASWE